MKYEEAVAIEHEITRMLVATAKEEHKERVFTAHKMAIEALEKQIPQKPIERWTGDGWVIKCPVCGKFFDDSEYEWVRQFCGGCGQKIDWSDTE